jgi:threonine aldolase
MLIDLRSDTFTKPTPEMLETMMNADVGDDVFGEDPTVNQLESLGATMFGMEAALFCPSGTMTNQIAIKCHTLPGNEVICEKSSHVYIYEGGGIAFNSSCQVKPIDGNRGRITATQILDSINSVDIHKPVSALVSIENTSNRGGGSCYEISELQSIKEVCLNNNIRLHLDGARIWNALVARQQNPLQYGEIFDSISICLSKGLGAPVGSLLLGNHEFIYKARRVRKVFGGGMRQAGYLAAAGLFAMENNISRLEIDHLHAKMIGDALSKKDFVSNILPIETNMIIFEVSGKFDAKSFSAYLKERNVFCIPISSSQVRMVTHLDITREMVNHLTALITTIQ